MINTVKRRELIIDQLCREGTVRLEQLSSQFAVSTVTIRSNLRHLDKSGCAVRAYGGAMLNKQFAFDHLHALQNLRARRLSPTNQSAPPPTRLQLGSAPHLHVLTKY